MKKLTNISKREARKFFGFTNVEDAKDHVAQYAGFTIGR